MPTGTVVSYFVDRAFGWIEPDNGEANLHVTWRDLQGTGFRYLATGERVRFDIETGDRGTPVARQVAAETPRLSGTVETWDQQRGQGRIRVAGQESEALFVHHSDILGHRRSTLKPEEFVTLAIQANERGQQKAIQVKRLDPRQPLYRFARMPDQEKWTEQLASLAEPEDWNRYGEDDTDGTRPILVSYLAHTFARLEQEERQRGRGDRVAKAEYEGRRYASFNTGLVTSQQEEIFAVFEANRPDRSDVWPFYFKWFLPESDRRLVSIFGGRLPDLARYVEDPADLIFDPDLELVIDAAHIVEDNLGRFPFPFSENRYMARQALESQITSLRRRARRNYKTAVPQLHHGTIQLLLPLALRSPEQADIALVVEKTGDCYRGATVLPLNWAYKNARLLTRPDPDWLVP